MEYATRERDCTKQIINKKDDRYFTISGIIVYLVNFCVSIFAILIYCRTHATQDDTRVPVILRLTHREMLRPPKFLSPCPSRHPIGGRPIPSSLLLGLSSRSLPLSRVLFAVMPRDCCYQRSDGNRQSIDAGRVSCSGTNFIYTFLFRHRT